MPPAPDELEVSIFGPGFGECVVLHLGFGDWVIIDSCRHLTTKQPVAIDYLKHFGVSLADSVRLVVATHWHDDHVQGISDVFLAAASARFACAGIFLASELQAFVECWGGTEPLCDQSGVGELRLILEELARRQSQSKYPSPIVACANKTLWSRHSNAAAEIRALSPSNAALMAALARLSQAVPPTSRIRRRLPDFSPNDASVVLSVQVGRQHVLLGGDLEVRHDPNLGWISIVNDNRENPTQYQAYKLPHHGSPNADHADIWQHLLIAEPWVVATPFLKGRVRLPSAEDARRIVARTKRAYLTAPPSPGRLEYLSSSVERTVREAALSIHVWPRHFGHVRLLKKIESDPAEPWQVQLFGAAMEMNEYVEAAGPLP